MVEVKIKNKSIINCKKKTRYSDELTALAATTHVSDVEGTQELYIYKCPHCKGWHMTGLGSGTEKRRQVNHYE